MSAIKIRCWCTTSRLGRRRNSRSPPERNLMTPNKVTVQKYMDGFTRTDHAAILSCLTDDVEWLIPGAVPVTGKPAFDEEVENEAFDGNAAIEVTRLVQGPDDDAAEGN